MKKLYRRFGSHVKLVRSHSFNGEDLVLAKYLPEAVGSYLDIGSGHPKHGSNTFLFYQRGWAGVTIDPLKKVHRLHKFWRKRDIQINACIGLPDNMTEIVTFYRYSADDFSTTSEIRYRELLARGITPIAISKTQIVKIKNLELTASPLEPCLLDIDIEGSEFEILKSIDWKLFTPRVIAVEEWESPIYEHTPIRYYLEGLGYLLESRTVITSIYVHREYLATAQFG